MLETSVIGDPRVEHGQLRPLVTWPSACLGGRARSTVGPMALENDHDLT